MDTLTGTYSASTHGMTRTLTLNVLPNGALSGTWDSSIQGLPAKFDLTGVVVRSQFNADGVYFSLAGHGTAYDQSHQPPTLVAANAIAGIASFAKGATPTAVTITLAWGEDGPGHSEVSDAWSNIVLLRQ